MRTAEISRNIAAKLEANPQDSKRALMIMQMIANLEGLPLTRKQHFGAAVMGGAIRAYDDAFDRYDIRSARRNGGEILKLLSGKNDGDTLDPKVRMGIILAQENLGSTAMSTLSDLTQAQIESLEQRNPRISSQRTEEITRKKGGATALLFALEINPNMSPQRRECYEELGYLMQLIDDLNDKIEDTRNKIITLVTHDSTKNTVVQRIKKQSEKVKQLFIQNYDQNKLRDLFSFIEEILVKGGVKV